MTDEKFEEFWIKWSEEWYKSTIRLRGKDVSISKLCAIKQDYSKVLCRRYALIKSIVKDSYFRDTSKRLSRYKRAAVIAYAINGASPLLYYDETIENDLDSDFLKQRLAFFVAIGSILQDYPERDVQRLSQIQPLFDFSALGQRDITDGEDDFLESVYKDLFYAEIYENYNVLTMANVFGLLTERASLLANLEPVDNVNVN